MNIFGKRAALTLFVFCSVCVSAVAPACTIDSCYTDIARIYLHPALTINDDPSGPVLLLEPERLSEIEASMDSSNCQLISGKYIGLPKSSPIFDEVYSMALTAVTTGKSILLKTAGMYLNDPTASCELLYVQMNG